LIIVDAAVITAAKERYGPSPGSEWKRKIDASDNRVY
jgi:hypothetical protein